MFRNRLDTCVFLIAALVLTAGAARAADEVTLRCVFTKGDKYVAVMNSDQDIEQHLVNQTILMKQTIRMEMEEEVLEVDARGTAKIKVTYTRILLKQNSPVGNIDYDSADPEKKNASHPALTGFKALVGKVITLTMTARGEIKSLTGTKQIAEAILKEIPKGPQREAARRQIAQMLNEENFAEQMSGMGIVFPEKALSVGQSWNHEQRMKKGFVSMVARTKYTVKEITPTSVQLAVESTIGPGDAPDKPMLMPMTVTINKGSQKGTMKIQRGNAILNSGRIDQNIEMTVKVQGQTINTTLKAVTTTSVTKK